MGRRSRKRSGAHAPAPDAGAPTPTPAAPPRPLGGPPRRRARLEEAPQAPWHPFPLVELAILCGIILVVVAFAAGGDARPILLFGGLGLVTLASLELTVREHFAGYRSHTTLLSAAAAIVVAVPLWLLPVPQEIILVVALAAGGAAAWALRRAFARKAGGLTWRS